MDEQLEGLPTSPPGRIPRPVTVLDHDRAPRTPLMWVPLEYLLKFWLVCSFTRLDHGHRNEGVSGTGVRIGHRCCIFMLHFLILRVRWSDRPLPVTTMQGLPNVSHFRPDVGSLALRDSFPWTLWIEFCICLQGLGC